MIVPARLDLTANRHTPFVYEIIFEDVNFTGATLDMHVRLYPDAPGSALIDLSPAAAGSQGLSLSYSNPDTTVTIQIDEATIEALDVYSSLEPEEDAELWYDLQITPSGGTKQVYLRGYFTIRAGVTT